MKNTGQKRDDRGASLVMVIVTVALVSILVMVVLSVSLMNMQMKTVNKQSVDNFYDAEAAMDEVRTGLQQEVSLAATTAYVKVMEKYSATSYQNEMRQNMFLSTYRQTIRSRLRQAGDENRYDLDKLRQYIGKSHRYDAATKVGARLSVQNGKEPEIVIANTGVLIRNLEMTYRNEQDFVSVVDTDLVLGYPSMNFTQSASVPDLLSYCIVADQGVRAENGNRKLTLDGNVYAGNHTPDQSGGFCLANGSSAQLGGRRTVISRGGLNLEENADFSTQLKATLWVDNLNLKSNSSLDISGTAYVADDLTIVGSGSATLRGEYYGYGNPSSAKLASSIIDEDVNRQESAYSSAMIVNGIADTGKASIHMTGLTKLMLAGNAYIGSGKAMMGESLAVKSSQISYLAPEDCFVIDTTNPTARTDLEDRNYWNETVLRKYHANGVLRQTNTDGLSYYFLKFANARDAADFYREYYSEGTEEGAAHTELRNKYLSLYVDERALTIREGSKTEKMLNGGILIWDAKGIRSIVPEFAGEDTDITDNSYYAKLQAGWQDMYSAYNCNLTSDYVRLSAEQRSATVFKNLVDVDAVNGLVSAGSSLKFSYTDTDGEHSGYLVRNTETFELDSSFLSGKDVSLIIATGDVKVRTDFNGTILCGGKLSFENLESEAVTVTADMFKASSLIQAASCEVAGTTHTLHEILKDSDYYLGGLGSLNAEGGKVELEELVTYKNWSKE